MAICKFEFDVNGLDSDVFEVVEFSGEEAISRIFRFELDLLSTDKELDFADIVNKPATLGMQREPGGEESIFNGLVVDCRQYGQTHDKARYQVTFMPRIWQLSYTYQSCVFQDKTVETIIGDVLAEHGFSQADIQFKLVGDYAERDFCVQYRETDLDFICRLMEFEGMYFYFDHSDEREVLVISDDRSNEEFVRDAQDSVVGYQSPEGLLPLDDVETVNEFVYKEQIVTGKVILKDYNYRDSEMPLLGEAAFNPEMPGMYYSYGSHFKDNEQGKRLAQVRNQEFECQRRTAEGRSDCIGFRGGYKMGLQGHYREDLNADYLLTRVRHRGKMIEGQGSYSNEFNSIPFEVQYRPERLTPEPRLPGILTAKVEGADETSQYASIDELGRYQVRLPFDQGDESLGSASKPIRLMQPSTGPGHGMHFPVHAGAEMIWACVDGNVDRPIGLGTVPNSSQVSPVTSENNNENLLQTSSGHRLSMDDNTENPTMTLSSLMAGEASTSGGYGGGTMKGRRQPVSQSGAQVREGDAATGLPTPQLEGDRVVRGGGEDGVVVGTNTQTETFGENIITMDSAGIEISTTSGTGCVLAHTPLNRANLDVNMLQLYSNSEAGNDTTAAQLTMSGTTGIINIQTPSTQEIIALGSGTGTGKGGITIGTKSNANTTIHGHSLILAGVSEDFDKLVIENYASTANSIIGYVNCGISTLLFLRSLKGKFESAQKWGFNIAGVYAFLKTIWSFVGAYKTLEGPISGAVGDDNYKSLAAGLDWTSKTTGSTTILGDDAINLLAPQGNVTLNANAIGLQSTSSTTITHGYAGVGISTMAMGITLTAQQGGITLNSNCPLDTISLDNAFGGVEIKAIGSMPWGIGGGITLSVAPPGFPFPQAAATKIVMDATNITTTGIAELTAFIDKTEVALRENKNHVQSLNNAVSGNSNAIAETKNAVTENNKAISANKDYCVALEKAVITAQNMAMELHN